MACTDDQLTATLLRRIAHAVDGNRTGAKVYVVVDTTPPYKVSLVTSSPADADALAATKPSYCVAGPYQTARDVEGEDPVFLIECHQPNSDWCEDPEVSGETFVAPSSPLPNPTDVESITVTWTRKDNKPGGSKTFNWTEGPMVDALFFSVAAVDKFLYPYIARVHGVRTAYEQRARLVQRIKERQKTGAPVSEAFKEKQKNHVAGLYDKPTKETKGGKTRADLVES